MWLLKLWIKNLIKMNVAYILKPLKIVAILLALIAIGIMGIHFLKRNISRNKQIA